MLPEPPLELLLVLPELLLVLPELLLVLPELLLVVPELLVLPELLLVLLLMLPLPPPPPPPPQAISRLATHAERKRLSGKLVRHHDSEFICACLVPEIR